MVILRAVSRWALGWLDYIEDCVRYPETYTLTHLSWRELRYGWLAELRAAIDETLAKLKAQD